MRKQVGETERLRSVDWPELTITEGWMRGTPAGEDVPCGNPYAVDACLFAGSGIDASESGVGMDPSASVPV